MKKHKAYLIKEKKIVFVDSIHWNKGYGGALQVSVDNPEFDPIKHIIDIDSNPDPMTDPFRVEPFFTYINHVLESHLKETPHEFILLRPVEIQDMDKKDVYEGDIVIWPHLSKEDTYEVYYNLDEYIWCARPIDCQDENETECYLNSSNMKVVGSIHDNK